MIQKDKIPDIDLFTVCVRIGYVFSHICLSGVSVYFQVISFNSLSLELRSSFLFTNRFYDSLIKFQIHGH